MNSRVEVLITALLNGTTMDFEPRSRVEEYLKNCLNGTGTEDLPDPNSRLDALMYKLAEKLEGGGGGGTPSDEIATDEEVSSAIDEIFNK